MESATVRSGYQNGTERQRIASCGGFLSAYFGCAHSKQNGWRTAKELHLNRIAVSGLPVSGYFKQLDDYYVAKAERSNHSVEFVGSGKMIDSAIGVTMPAATVEKLLPRSRCPSTASTCDEQEYRLVETGWTNNIRMNAGFFPGSGFQTPGDGSTGAIRGRLEFGNRTGNLKFVARYDNASLEYAKLKAQTTGAAVITLAFDINNSLQITWQMLAFAVVEIGETDQILTVAVESPRSTTASTA